MFCFIVAAVVDISLLGFGFCNCSACSYAFWLSCCCQNFSGSPVGSLKQEASNLKPKP